MSVDVCQHDEATSDSWVHLCNARFDVFRQTADCYAGTLLLRVRYMLGSAGVWMEHPHILCLVCALALVRAFSRVVLV